MRISHILVFVGISWGLECPIWDCSKAGSDKCFEKSNNKIHAGSNCLDEDTNVCHLGKYQLNSNYQLCRYPEDYKQFREEEVSFYRFLTDQCTDNIYHLFNCDYYCTGTNQNLDLEYALSTPINNTVSLRRSSSSRGGKSRSCKVDKFISNLKHNSKGLTGWAECTDDFQCASTKCACAPTLNGKGRCTTSRFDSDFYWHLFNQVCKRGGYWWDPSDYDDYVCSAWMHVKRGHIIQAYKELNSSLSCLKGFTDTEFLTTQVSAPWSDIVIVILVIVIVLLVFGLCFGLVYLAIEVAKARKQKSMETELHDDTLGTRLIQ